MACGAKCTIESLVDMPVFETVGWAFSAQLDGHDLPFLGRLSCTSNQRNEGYSALNIFQSKSGKKNVYREPKEECAARIPIDCHLMATETA